jgi:alanine racemase
MLKWVEIDRKSIASNVSATRRLLDRGTALMAVVKADAYGHGAVEISKLAIRAGADCLGVLTVDEANILRQAGLNQRIIILCPPLPEEASAVARLNLEPTVDSPALLRALSKKARRTVRVHIDVDFGLGRWGVKPKELKGLLDTATRLKKIQVAGISAHLDYVPGQNTVEAEDKLGEFNRLSHNAAERFPGVVRHCANSSILLDFPHWQMDMVRVGNLLYGINRSSREVPLKSPWKLCARITSIKEIGKGRPLGYAAEYLAPRRMRVASLPIGYADGLTMEPAERFIGFGKRFHYWGWWKNKKVPLIGRTGIAHVLVDVSAAGNAKVGDIVHLHVRRTAASARLPRIYK